MDSRFRGNDDGRWILAFAGMTVGGRSLISRQRRAWSLAAEWLEQVAQLHEESVLRAAKASERQRIGLGHRVSVARKEHGAWRWAVREQPVGAQSVRDVFNRRDVRRVVADQQR